MLASFVFVLMVSSERPALAEPPAPKPDYVPNGEYFPRGSWAAGFGATVESSSFAGRDAASPSIRSSRYGIESRSGYFLANRFLIGLRATYEVALHRETLPSATGASPVVVIEGSEQAFEIGPWFRYYFPVGNGWALFAQADWGYRSSFEEEKVPGAPARTTKGRGVAVGFGGGLTYFLTKAVAFDVAGRVSLSRPLVSGSGPRSRVDFSEFGLVLGFQVYLPEFVF